MKENTFIVIQSWMRTKLNLSGVKLLTYAIIYGFSQDGETRFTGSRQYIADWCGCTVRSVQSTLNELVDSELIIKYEYTRNGVKYCEYSVNRAKYNENVADFTPSEKISPPPSEKISLNNIDNNKIESNISKDISQPATSFFGSGKPKEKPKKLSLYDKCVAEIYTLTDDAELQKCLLSYLPIRLAMKDKPIYGVNQWTGMLTKLISMKNPVSVVKTSIERGWASFFDGNQDFNSNKDTFSEYGVVKSDKREDSEFYGEF